MKKIIATAFITLIAIALDVSFIALLYRAYISGVAWYDIVFGIALIGYCLFGTIALVFITYNSDI